MSEPPFYPADLVMVRSYGRGRLGDARIGFIGWTFQFHDGSLRISATDGVNVIELGVENTERLIDLVRALDSGRYSADFALREKS